MEFKLLLNELRKVLKGIDKNELAIFKKEINQCQRIFVVGAGRSGLIAKNLAMRLVRLQKNVFVVNETVIPKVRSNDLLIAISGSGETSEVISAVKLSRVLGARILGITAIKDSPLAKLSHSLIIIPAKIPQRLGIQYQLRELIGVPERSPVKSLFELASLIFLEVVVDKLNEEKNVH